MVNSIRSGSRNRNICMVVFHNFSWIFGHATCLQYSFHKSSQADKKRTDGTSAQTICTTLKHMRTSLNHLLQVLRHVCYNVKTQQHSSQWKPKSFPKLKKKQDRADRMWRSFCCFDCWDFVHNEFVPKSSWPSYSIYKRQCTTKDWNFGMNTGCLCTTTLLQTQCSLCRGFERKQNSSNSTATLQLWSLSSRLFMFPKLAANIKERRYESTEELHSNITAEADLLKILCRMLGKTELLLEYLY